jgi:4'-phosphopantetheinyl transferase
LSRTSSAFARLRDQSGIFCGRTEIAHADVWTVSLDEPFEALLSAEEQQRAERFRFERDRVRWSHAHSALRAILSKYVNTPPLEMHFEIGAHGKPSIPGVEFNLSHAGGWAMIAVSECAPVGVDIEAVRENVEMARLLERIGETALSGSREDLFRVWTRREARTKAIGGPLMEVPSGDLRVVDLVAPEGFVAALAMVGRDSEIRYRRLE